MTPEQFAALSPEDQQALLRRLQLETGAQPEDPNLAAAAVPITPDPPVLPARRPATSAGQDLALRRLARNAGVTMAQARQMVEADAMQGDPADPGTKYRSLRDLAVDRNEADLARRTAEVSKKAQLRSNPIGYLGRTDITADQRRVVAEALPINPQVAQMRNAQGENDARVQVANIQAQAQRDAAAAEAAGRDANQRWMMEFKTAADERAERARMAAEERAERARLAAEERARTAGREDKTQQRDFDREQKDLDRQAAAAQGDTRMQAELAKLQADLEARRLEFEERSKQFDLQQAEAARRHDQTMEQMRIEREGNTARWTAQEASTRAARDQEQQKFDAAMDAQKKKEALAAREAVIAPLRARHPGVDNLASGDYDTPAAQEALNVLAADSDKTWFGYGDDDALRMDAVLFRLGVFDPMVRHALVAKHGFGRAWSSVGTPQYPIRQPGTDGSLPPL